MVGQDLRKNNSLVLSHTSNLNMEQAHMIFGLSMMIDESGIILEANLTTSLPSSHFFLVCKALPLS